MDLQLILMWLVVLMLIKPEILLIDVLLVATIRLLMGIQSLGEVRNKLLSRAEVEYMHYAYEMIWVQSILCEMGVIYPGSK